MIELVPVISVVGKSDSGKTTLIEKLTRELKRRGYRVGTVKHDVHGFDMDKPGKDTWRHAQAGANTVVISSKGKMAMIRRLEGEMSLDEIAEAMAAGVDIILTEGYKRADKPKIEVFRSDLHREPLCSGDSSLIAVAGDSPIELGVPWYSWDDAEGIADFIERRFLLGRHREAST